MKREEATELIMEAKKAKGLSWETIGKTVGAHKIWVTSVLLGQNSMSKDQAEAVCSLLGLDANVAKSLQECPMKGDLKSIVPVDPLIYRFYEITQCYGSTMKEIIHEMFGDGIMSAIDFTINIDKKADPKGDRVVVTFDGKFLPYKKW